MKLIFCQIGAGLNKTEFYKTIVDEGKLLNPL